MLLSLISPSNDRYVGTLRVLMVLFLSLLPFALLPILKCGIIPLVSTAPYLLTLIEPHLSHE